MLRSECGYNTQPILPRTPVGLGNSLNSLLDSARIFMARALAPSTLKAYSHAWSLFNLFCISMHASVSQCRSPLSALSSSTAQNPVDKNRLLFVETWYWYSIHARCQDSGFPSLLLAPAIRLLPKVTAKSTRQTLAYHSQYLEQICVLSQNWDIPFVYHVGGTTRKHSMFTAATPVSALTTSVAQQGHS